MKFILRVIPITCFFTCLFSQLFAQHLQVNELMSVNSTTIYDEEGDTPDWIEIKNSGNNDINLSKFYLSDDSKELKKWQLPDMILSPNEHLIIFASDKNRRQTPVIWNTIIDMGDNWNYIVPNSEPPALWKTNLFDSSGWSTGISGIGYGDDDDNTMIPPSAISLFMITKFSVENVDDLRALWFHMDYDDGFVAYLNGEEIARAGLGAPGSNVIWNQSASSHEALIVNGQAPEGFNCSEFIHLLTQHDNVLAVQVHNIGTGSSDLTSIPFLTIGTSYSGDDLHNSAYINLPVLYPHANFKLSSEGETIYLSSASSVIDSIKFGAIPHGYSFGRSGNDPEDWGFFKSPTPGTLNNTTINYGYAKGVVEFSPKEMFVSSPVQLVLSGAKTGEEIRYTLNGSEPTAMSNLYTSPITIDKNTPVRAAAFIPGGVAGKIASHTYIFDTAPTLPVISIATDSMNLWDNEAGIYVLGDSYENQNPYYGANFWEDWEKPASVEMFDNSGNELFSLNCGIKIFGNWSRAHPQKSLAVFFRNDYGDPELEGVQLFRKKPITKFKSFVLRNSGNDFYQSRFRDVFMTDLVSDMNIDMQASEPLVLYLNGEYWGHMNLREKINEEYLESNHGVEADSVDILENYNSVVEGSNSNYLDLLDFLEKYNISVDKNYNMVSEMIDIENYIDYLVSQIYFANSDWPGNNMKYWRPQTDAGKWRWIIYDTDFGFGLSSSYADNMIDFATEPNGPSWPNPPWSTLLLRQLLQNKNFEKEFINRFADMMNTTFLPVNVSEKIDSIAAILQPEISKHKQRWGTPSLSTWNQEIQKMKTFAQYRLGYVRNHIKQKFTLPANHEVTLSIAPEQAGNIKLNTITIAKNGWKGQYFQDVPITVKAISYNGFKFIGWKVNGVTMVGETIDINITQATNITAIFEENEDDGMTIAINEINYNSPDNYDAGDWIELYNYGNTAIDISGWILKDDDDAHIFPIPENVVLASGGYLVICRYSESFSLVHPYVENYIGEIDFGFSSSGDAVRLYNSDEILVDEVYFTSVLPWTTGPNGTGLTLELINPKYQNNISSSWKSSKDLLGTPGRKNSVATNVKYLAQNADEKLQVYPNPFSATTTIFIERNDFYPLEIRIFSIDGRLVFTNTIANNKFVWDGKSNSGQQLKPGIYVCNIIAEGELFTKKLILTQ